MPAGRKLIGLAEDRDVSGVDLRDYYTDESWTELRDVAVPAVNRSGHWEGKSRLRHAENGRGDRRADDDDAGQARAGDGPTCLAIVHRGATKLSQLQAALAEAQARKHAILESSLDPIITINHEGVITEFNRAAEQTFGHPREKVLGTRPSEVLFPPSTSAGQQDRIDRYLERRRRLDARAAGRGDGRPRQRREPSPPKWP